MTQLVVKLFGMQATLAGQREVPIEVELPVTSAQVMAKLRETAPALGPTLGTSRLAVNQSFAGKEQTITPDDELALIGLVGGG